MTPITLRPAPASVNPLPFAAIPHDLLNDRRLTATDILLVGALLRYARSKPSCWPSVETLAKDVGRCRRTVQYGLRRLRDSGWIALEDAGNPTGRVIILLWRRAAACTPVPVQPYSQGLPRPRAQGVAPQEEMEKKKEGSAPPPAIKPRNPEDLRPPDDLREHYAEWLSKPEGHRLRRLALERIAADLGRAK